MDKLIVASMREGAGKTSVIIGMAEAAKTGYMKPFGDRLHYRKKRLWDYDSALVTNILGLKENPEDMSIGFEHSKLRFTYDEGEIKEKLLENVSNIEADKDILFVEGGKNLEYGVSVYLDAISVAKYIDGKLLIVMSGNDDAIVDDIIFLKKYIDMRNVNFIGVIINKVHDVEDFKNVHLDSITKMGVNVLGVIPYEVELTYFSVDYLSHYLFAKVIAGENGLNNVVKNIFVGATSADAALRKPEFKKEKKLIITGGDRSDMILAALESDTTCIILTNNILPPANIISKASNQNVPLLLVSSDTYQTAKQIDNLAPLLTKDNTEKIELLKELIKRHVNIST
jgi:BioD-like phosphotransacetylase family protein